MSASEPGDARTLWSGGPTGLPLGVGTWAWGDRGYWGYGRDYTSADVAAAYGASRDAGLTLFDTAKLYGRGTSEQLGRLIADRADSAGVAVATKFAALPWRVGRRGPLRAALEAGPGCSSWRRRCARGWWARSGSPTTGRASFAGPTRSSPGRVCRWPPTRSSSAC